MGLQYKGNNTKEAAGTTPAAQTVFIEEGREPKRFRNIEIPDEIKFIPYKDFKFDVPESGRITFKIWFEQGSLPAEWPEARTCQHRVKAAETAPAPVIEDTAEETPEMTTEEESGTMEVDFKVTGDRRKLMEAAIGAWNHPVL